MWFPKVTADLDGLGELRVSSPTESCFHRSSNISDINNKTFRWPKFSRMAGLIVGIEGSPSGEERSKILKWKVSELLDIEEDLQNLAKDLSVSLTNRFRKLLIESTVNTWLHRY